jgi:hypothetical protein
MARIARWAPLALLWGLEQAYGACEPGTTPEAPPASIPRSEIKAVIVDPGLGAPVNGGSILAIDLEFLIKDFEEGRYNIFPTLVSGPYNSKPVTIDGRLLEVVPATAAGKVRMCLPLTFAYGEEAEFLTWPLELKMFLNRREDNGSYLAVAVGKIIKLNTIDMPEAALRRQAEAPPPEYEDSLKHVFDEFARSKAIYKVCLRRFPALQPRLTPAYREWEARYKADMDYVWELTFESFKRRTGGRADIAMKMLDMTEEMQEKWLNERSAEDLDDSCQRILDDANPEDDFTSAIVAPHLEIVRRWQEKK